MMKKFFGNYLDDLFYWLGVGLISAGVYFIYPPAALIVLGLFCLAFGIMVGKVRGNQASSEQSSVDSDR